MRTAWNDDIWRRQDVYLFKCFCECPELDVTSREQMERLDKALVKMGLIMNAMKYSINVKVNCVLNIYF